MLKKKPFAIVFPTLALPRSGSRVVAGQQTSQPLVKLPLTCRLYYTI